MWEAALESGWQAESPYILTLAALLAVIVAIFGGDNRASVYRTAFLFAAATLGQFFAGFLTYAEFDAGARFVYSASLLLAGFAMIRLAGMLVFRVLLLMLHIQVLRIVEDIVIILLYVAWLLVRLRASGFDPSSLLASTAVATAVVAFAMQDTLGNILGGLAIQLDNSIKVGDWIRVDDSTWGQVVDIRWRSTAIETTAWETVMVPNSALMKSKFSVLGRRRANGSGAQGQTRWRRSIPFNVDLAAPPTRVIPAIEAAIREAEIAHVATTPAPNCVLVDFAHGYGCYVLRYWLTDPPADLPTDSQVRVHIYTALQRAGLRLAVQEHDVRLTEQTEEHRIQVYEREVERRLSALKVVDLFAGLNAQELRTVAERLTYSPFAQGEVITRQGNVAHWLYILTGGEADIMIEAEGGARQRINTLGAGSFFGETGLMTGAPRSATVVARTNVECYRLDKSAFESVLHSRPEMAEEISRVMISRQGALHAAVSANTVNTQSIAGRHRELLEKIRSFFALNTPSK